MILLHGFGMYDAKVAANVRIPEIRALEFLVLLIGEVGHRALELGDDGAGLEISGGENAQFRLASTVGVARSVSNFN